MEKVISTIASCIYSVVMLIIIIPGVPIATILAGIGGAVDITEEISEISSMESKLFRQVCFYSGLLVWVIVMIAYGVHVGAFKG